MEKETVSNEVVWSPSDKKVKSSQMYKFMKNINKKYNITTIVGITIGCKRVDMSL